MRNYTSAHFEGIVSVSVSAADRQVGACLIDAGSGILNIYTEDATAMLRIGEKIVAGAKGVLAQRTNEATAADAAAARTHTAESHIVGQYGPCDGSCTPEWQPRCAAAPDPFLPEPVRAWTAEEIIQREA